MTQTIPVTQARRDLLKLVDEVNENYSRVDITKKGKIRATLVSPDFLDSMEETLYSLKYSLKDIREAEKRFRKREYVTLEELKKDYQARKRKIKNVR